MYSLFGGTEDKHASSAIKPVCTNHYKASCMLQKTQVLQRSHALLDDTTQVETPTDTDQVIPEVPWQYQTNEFLMAQRMLCSCTNSQIVVCVNHCRLRDTTHCEGQSNGLFWAAQTTALFSTEHKPELEITACGVVAQQSFSLTMDFEIKRWILPVLRQSPRLTRARTQSQAAAFLRGSRHPDAHIRWITFECAVLDVVCGTTPGTILEAAEKTIRRRRPLAKITAAHSNSCDVPWTAFIHLTTLFRCSHYDWISSSNELSASTKDSLRDTSCLLAVPCLVT